MALTGGRRMTNELEKQFFDTFGIEPHYYCADEYVFEAMLEYECTEGNREKCKTCKKVGKTYPQITDRILLDLICIGTQFFAELVLLTSDNIEDLKEQVLTIYLKTAYKDKLKHQVQALFGGND
jgi:hypothetical protein